MLNIRGPRPHETDDLVDLGVQTGLFTSEEAAQLLGETLRAFHANALGEGHEVAVAEKDGDIAGWTYFAPDAHAAGVTNLWWIGVSLAHRGTDVGVALLRRCEAASAAAGARIVVIETGEDASTARARAVYSREGYQVCGNVPEFYGPGEAKVVFVKRLK